MSTATVQTVAGADPRQSATVSASAGSGKTWLLVARMIRLLMNGAKPDDILALTFTKKAAAEMAERLRTQLAEFVTCDDDALVAKLATLGLQPNEAIIQRARGLYETLLNHPWPLRSSTFHAFCQELLQRFAFEADIPPGFELLEDDSEAIRMAWSALLTEATGDRQQSRLLKRFLLACGSLSSAETSLFGFVTHRLDWWVFSEGLSEAEIEQATKERFDAPASTEDAYQHLFSDELLGRLLVDYVAILTEYGIKKFDEAAAQFAIARDPSIDEEDRLTAFKKAVLTDKGEPRKHEQQRATMAKRFSVERAEQFFVTHSLAAQRIAETDERIKRLHNQQLTLDWITLGQRFLDHYQRIKAERRQLDFADLEYIACRLLSDPELGSWVHYKLDARIEHLLIDEFQDTNPTQWRLLSPLLKEIAAGDPERPRTAFIVGDEKQSIYAFRRANPELLGEAAVWMRSHTMAKPVPLDNSRRSSPAIMEIVNRVFGEDGPLPLPSFPTHGTHLSEQWGQVTLLPQLASPKTDEDELAPSTFRNPLIEARQAEEDQRIQLEARQIASQILELHSQATAISVGKDARAMDWGDVLILFRRRTHSAAIEHALREASIPFEGADADSFSGALEVQDILALLQALDMPWDNVATAQALRSPIFSVDDSALIEFATSRQGNDTNPWLLRLIDATECPDSALDRARRLLTEWKTLADYLPVHDLLDRIFHDGDVINRYQQAFPPALRGRVLHNLSSLCGLALETDSGRYPALSRFVARARQTKTEAGDINANRVRLMTIHGAKGLEAPIVFIANAASSGSGKDAWKAAVNWPADAAKPVAFGLRLPKTREDDKSAELAAVKDAIDAREEKNLLYVALTRARQFLFISGYPAKKGAKETWYSAIAAAIDDIEPNDDNHLILRDDNAVPNVERPVETATEAIAIDPALTQPIYKDNGESDTDEPAFDDPDARLRGSAIHRLLEWLGNGIEADTASLRLASELGLEARTVEPWMAEAKSVLAASSLAWIFDPSNRSWSEQGIWVDTPQGARYRVIDRLVEHDGALWIIDWKTDRIDADKSAVAAAQHAPQLQRYRDAVGAIWPDQDIRTAIVFTGLGELVEV